MEPYRMIDGKDFTDFTAAFLSFIKKVFGYIVASVRAYFTTAIAVFILVICVGLFWRSRSKAFYESEMVCTFKELNKKNYGEMLHSLDILAKGNSYESLAKELDISVQDAKSIISIEGKNMAGSKLYEDITPDKNPIYIDVKTTDKNVFMILQPRFVYYLNNSDPYLNDKLKRDSVTANETIKYLNNNVSTTDSVIALYYAMAKNTVSIPDASAYIPKLDSLLKYKADQEIQLVMQKRIAAELKNNVEVLHGFVLQDRPVDDKAEILRVTIITALLLSVFSAVMSKAIHTSKLQPA